MAGLDFSRYEPTKLEREILHCSPFWWAYVKGREIVQAYGNNLPLELRENVDYLVINCVEDPDSLESMRVYSNKWLYSDYVTIDEKFKVEDSWQYVCEEYQKNGCACNLHGHLGIIAYPFKLRAVVFFDTTDNQVYLIPHDGFRDKPGLEDIFKKTDERFGSLAKYYKSQAAPVFEELNVRPCGEYASFVPVEYSFCEGWRVIKFLGNYLKRNCLDAKATYLVFRKEKSDETMSYIYHSNKWGIEAKNKKKLRNKIDPRAKEINSIRHYLNDQRYSNQPCKIGNKKVILCYPVSTYNAVVWDIEDNTVWVLPTKRYNNDEYFKKLEAHFGKLTFL